MSDPTLNLGEVARHVEVYRRLWAQHGFDPRATRAEFSRIPLLTKDDFRQAGLAGRLDDRFCAQDAARERTGGSSGEPVEILIDNASRRRRQWRFLRALMSVGYRPGHRLWIVSTHRSSRVNALARWTYVDLRESEQALAARFLAERPQVMYGPLRALLSMGQDLPRLDAIQRPRVLIATAELLRQEDQRELREIFGITAADFYGMTEIGLFATRAPGARHYRIVADDIHVEYLPCDSDPGLERLVLTTLKPCAMPLLRYDTGDLVRRDHSTPGAPIVEFVGREIDGILLASGKRVSPYRLTLALETVPNITRYQVVQRADLSVDVLVQTTDRNVSALHQKAQAAIAAVIGPGLTVRAGALIAAGRSIAEKFRPVRSYASPAR